MTGKTAVSSKAKYIMLGTGIFIGLVTVIASAGPPPANSSKELVQTQSAAQVKDASTAAKQEPKKPVVTVKTIEEVVTIPYASTTQNDPTLATGKTLVAVAGVAGEKTVTYTVTYTDGIETGREPAGERILREPVAQVTKVGTKVAAAPAPRPAGNCHPSYTGACVPKDVRDVDCAGGSGDGPYYTGRVTVVGYDEYGLDRDGDGVACER